MLLCHFVVEMHPHLLSTGYNGHTIQSAVVRREGLGLNDKTVPICDTVLRNGTILDGTGKPAFRGDIGIIGDQIVAIGDLSSVRSAHVYDLQGLHVAPGFIDIHTHSDISVTFDPGQASALAMGVTTQVVGNCGLSMGLVQNTDVFEMERRWLAPHGARIRWNSFEEHLHLVEERGVATNYVPLVGHGSLRKRIMGKEPRKASSAELNSMQNEIARAMEAGAWGFSSGLEYTPSAFADVDELVALCDVVAQFKGFYATHLRNEGDTLLESVEEALLVSERSGVPLQLSHHKAEGRKNWGKVAQTLEMVNRARERGMDVQLDQYPYTAFMTSLAVQVLPTWANAGSFSDIAERILDPDTRAKIVAEIRLHHPEWDILDADSHWHRIQIGICRSQPDLEGRTIASIAGERGKSPLDAVLELLSTAKDYISAVNFAIGEEDIVTVLRHPFTSIGSDGVGTHPEIVTGGEKIHPRTYGTFPRLLAHYVRELGVLTEEEAIFKMTGLPAKRIGLERRGQIALGHFADLTVYSPETITDSATFETPHRYAEGIAYVFVNGSLAYQAENPEPQKSGRVLRPKRNSIEKDN